jgi:hypothetical protein
MGWPSGNTPRYANLQQTVAALSSKRLMLCAFHRGNWLAAARIRYPVAREHFLLEKY